jgi:hypothetical protein
VCSDSGAWWSITAAEREQALSDLENEMSENEDTQGADDAPAVPSETMDLSDVLDEWQDYLLSLQDTDEQSSRSVEKALPDLILMHHVRRRVGFLQLPPEGHMDPEEWALRILGADEDSTEWEWYARTLVENAPKSLVATLAAW